MSVEKVGAMIRLGKFVERLPPEFHEELYERVADFLENDATPGMDCRLECCAYLKRLSRECSAKKDVANGKV